MRLATLAALVSFAALVLLACGKKSNASTESASSSMIAAVTGEARVVADEHGFTPPSIALAKGAGGSKATVTFVRTTDKTCATEVVFPALGVKKDLPLNQPVTIDVPTDTARTLAFQCGMAMYKGAILVKDVR